jgi:DNA-binding transcriptional MocR family regulator
VLQRLLLRLWRDLDVAAALAAAADGYARRRRSLRSALAARGLDTPGATGLNVWVPVVDETRAVAVLRDAGYAVAPGSLFRIASAPGVRITVSPLDDALIPALADAIVAAAHPIAVAPPSR